jgi:hypothetical protein
MRKFWRMLLRKNLPADLLTGLQYAVFGLGDSGYVKYNVSTVHSSSSSSVQIDAFLALGCVHVNASRPLLGSVHMLHVTPVSGVGPVMSSRPCCCCCCCCCWGQVAAKKLDRRLAALGAEPLLERGLGDDQVTAAAAVAAVALNVVAAAEWQESP